MIKMIKKWKKSTKFTNHKIGKEKEKEILVQKYIYVCTLNKYGKTCCETQDVLLQDPFDCLCGKPQSA
jgi:hypothetical protein